MHYALEDHLRTRKKDVQHVKQKNLDIKTACQSDAIGKRKSQKKENAAEEGCENTPT